MSRNSEPSNRFVTVMILGMTLAGIVIAYLTWGH